MENCLDTSQEGEIQLFNVLFNTVYWLNKGGASSEEVLDLMKK